MDRRSLLQLFGHASAAILLMRGAQANNLPPAQAQTAEPVPPPAPPPAIATVTAPQTMAAPAPGERFSVEWLEDTARQLARMPYQEPPAALPRELADLNYDTYRMIAFRRDKSIWNGENLPFILQMFSAGYIYKLPVQINIVENGVVTPYRYSPDLFIYDPRITPPPPESTGGFSGFRIHTTINSLTKLEEFVVFQGASYFRSFAQGQEYGLSARGLAINTAQMPGEEFPRFSDFWVEKPGPLSDQITVHALLVSPSMTGAYTFRIANRGDTVMDVACKLFPRREIKYVGIAPLTSMFRSGPSDLTNYSDYRPRVYDSEGLEIWNGNGEQIWRPLINPERLQYSVFVDENPKGFGLSIRNRDFRQYQDVYVRYDLRPGLWVEPLGAWGPGSVDLIELPSPTEYNDNIVAFWRPKEPMQANTEHAFSYRLHWNWTPPLRRNYAYVTQTMVAVSIKPGWHSFHLDFANTDGIVLCAEGDYICSDKRANVRLSASTSEFGDMYFQPNKVLGGHRLSFDFRTKGVDQADIRCMLVSGGKRVSEIWTYRWTA